MRAEDKDLLRRAVQSAGREVGLGHHETGEAAMMLLPHWTVEDSPGIPDAPDFDPKSIAEFLIMGSKTVSGRNLNIRHFRLLDLIAGIPSALSGSVTLTVIAFAVALLGSLTVKLSSEQAALLIAVTDLRKKGKDPLVEDVMHRMRGLLLRTDLGMDDVIKIAKSLQNMGVDLKVWDGRIDVRETLVALPA